MAWNKLPKTRQSHRPILDRFDLEAEAEAIAIRSSPGILGPRGKRLKGHNRHDPRGEAIANFRALKHIEIIAA